MITNILIVAGLGLYFFGGKLFKGTTAEMSSVVPKLTNPEPPSAQEAISALMKVQARLDHLKVDKDIRDISPLLLQEVKK